MNPTSEDIKDMLEAESSLGLTFRTNLFIGREPDRPSDCTTIFDTPGGPPMLALSKADSDYYYPSIQIRVRTDMNSYQEGWDLINAIKVLLHGVGPEVWNGTTYTLIRCVGEPFLLGRDENQRPWFVVNFDIQRRE